MRYLLLIYGNEAERTAAMESAGEADQQEEMQRWYTYSQDLRDAGVSTHGEALQPTSTATSVRDQNGAPLVTDGPFAETKEQLGGFYLLDVPNLDEAIKWAHRCPGSRYGTIELRPIMEIPDAP